jgi:hypothetical protein
MHVCVPVCIKPAASEKRAQHVSKCGRQAPHDTGMRRGRRPCAAVKRGLLADDACVCDCALCVWSGCVVHARLRCCCACMSSGEAVLCRSSVRCSAYSHGHTHTHTVCVCALIRGALRKESIICQPAYCCVCCMLCMRMYSLHDSASVCLSQMLQRLATPHSPCMCEAALPSFCVCSQP